MKIDILTLFPEMFESLKTSIIGRASKKNILEINIINIRDFAKDKHKKVDDTPYGGGAGMVLMAQPYVDAYESVPKFEKTKTIMLSPYIICSAKIPLITILCAAFFKNNFTFFLLIYFISILIFLLVCVLLNKSNLYTRREDEYLDFPNYNLKS